MLFYQTLDLFIFLILCNFIIYIEEKFSFIANDESHYHFFIKYYKFFKYEFFKMLCYKNIINSYVKYSRNTENVFKSFIIWHHEVQ